MTEGCLRVPSIAPGQRGPELGSHPLLIADEPELEGPLRFEQERLAIDEHLDEGLLALVVAESVAGLGVRKRSHIVEPWGVVLAQRDPVEDRGRLCP